MNSLLFLFVVVFVLALAAVCALLVLRMLGTLAMPESPPFPYRRHAVRHHVHAGPEAKGGRPAGEEVVEKK